MQKDKIKTDLSALFTPRQPPMSNEEAVSIVDQLGMDPINLSHSILALQSDNSSIELMFMYYANRR